MSSSEISVLRADASHASLVVELFARADVPCFCQYYEFEGDHRDWQNRCANEREQNQNALVTALKQGSLTAVVALLDQAVVGWARLDAPANLSKLYEGRLYRGLPCFSGDREKTRALRCFLVDPSLRRRGVAEAMLRALLQLAREEGALSVEAFPRGATDVSDGEQWTGPLGLYEATGFVRVHDFAPYPVYRISL